MEYIEVSIEITPFQEEFADILIAETEDLGFESYVTEAPFLKAYIPRDHFSEPDLKTVLSTAGNGLFSIKHTLKLYQEENWNALWESSFDPVTVDGRCTILAPYHEGLPETEFMICIEPKMAFGTGHHQTTALMIRTLLSMEKEIAGRRVLDMGCGTGVLSILCARLQAAAPVHAIDIDHIAAESARENAERNGVGGKIKTLCGDASLIQAGQYDLVLANINRNILLNDFATYARSLRPDGLGTILVSGFYTEDIPMLEAEAARHGLKRHSFLTDENWAAVRFQKA